MPRITLNCGVYVCGPNELVMAAEDACLQVEKEISSRKSINFDFHSEAFQVGLLCFVLVGFGVSVSSCP
jgi:hypothetical protein